MITRRRLDPHLVEPQMGDDRPRRAACRRAPYVRSESSSERSGTSRAGSAVFRITNRCTLSITYRASSSPKAPDTLIAVVQHAQISNPLSLEYAAGRNQAGQESGLTPTTGKAPYDHVSSATSGRSSALRRPMSSARPKPAGVISVNELRDPARAKPVCPFDHGRVVRIQFQIHPKSRAGQVRTAGHEVTLTLSAELSGMKQLRTSRPVQKAMGSESRARPCQARPGRREWTGASLTNTDSIR